MANKYGVTLADNNLMCDLLTGNDNQCNFDFLIQKNNLDGNGGNGNYSLRFLDLNDQLFSITKNNWRVSSIVNVYYNYSYIFATVTYFDPFGTERIIKSDGLGVCISQRPQTPVDAIEFIYKKLNELSVFTNFLNYDLHNENKKLKDEVILLKKLVERLEADL